MSKALVLFSGGMDSTFCMFHAGKNFDKVDAITFDYGQRHRIEVKQARVLMAYIGGDQHIVTTSQLIKHKNCPLMDAFLPMDVFENYEEAEQKLKGRIEPALVPMRNSIFLDIAVNRAICDDCYDIYIGVSKEDGDTVPDCTQKFLEDYEGHANVALGFDKLPLRSLKIHAPLLTLGKVNGIHEAFNYPGCYAAWAFSHTSYFGEYPPRARDHASVCREWAFRKAGVPDPLIVRAYLEGKMPLPENELYEKWGWEFIDIRNHYESNEGLGTWEIMQDFEVMVRARLVNE